MTPKLALAVFGGGLAVCLALFIAAHLEHRRSFPRFEYRGIRVRYLDGAERPWRGIAQAIDTLVDVTTREFRHDAPDLLRGLWIEVVPYNGFCRSPSMPTGVTKIYEDHRVVWVRANGTIRIERGPPLAPAHPVLVVRQTRAGDTPHQSRHALGTGPLNDAGYGTALFHEFAEHWVPLHMRGDSNVDHKNTAMAELTRRYQADYERRRPFISEVA